MDKKCRRIYSELISFCMQSGEKLMFFRNKDIVNLSDLYSIYKRMEYALFDFGSLLFDMESKLPEDILKNFNLERLTASEKIELKYYLDRFKPEMIDCCFEEYGDGYRAVLPYLLNRRATGYVFSKAKVCGQCVRTFTKPKQRVNPKNACGYGFYYQLLAKKYIVER